MTDLHPSLHMMGSGGVAGKSNSLISCTVLPTSDIWVSLSPGDLHAQGRDIHRNLTGSEALLLNGFPATMNSNMRDFIATYPNGFVQELAGNAFPATIISAFVIAIQFAFDLDQSKKRLAPEKESDDDLEMVMGLLKKARQS